MSHPLRSGGSAVIPIEASDEQLEAWVASDGALGVRYIIGGPHEGPDVIPCLAIVVHEINVTHVAYQLDEIELAHLAHLAHGNPLWLTTWGGLPVHLLSVGTPEIS